MSTYDNTNRGAMFKNARKTTEKHPDYTGSLDVGGVSYWVSGWINKAGPQAKTPGAKYLSLQVTPKDEEAEVTEKFPKQSDIDDDDIPF